MTEISCRPFVVFCLLLSVYRTSIIIATTDRTIITRNIDLILEYLKERSFNFREFLERNYQEKIVDYCNSLNDN